MSRFIVSLPVWIVFSGLLIPFALAMHLPMRMMFIAVIPFYVWIYSLGVTAHQASPESARMPISRFRAALVFAAGYMIVAMVYLHAIMPYAIPFHLLSTVCMFYCLYYVAKSMRSAELKRETRAGEWFELFIGLWFFPVGIWFVQPMIRRIVNGSRSDAKKILPPRPVLISIGMVAAAISAFGALAVMPYIIITEDYIILNGQQISTREFALREMPINLVYGALCLAIFIAFLKGKTWSRHVVLFFWGVVGILLALESRQETASAVLAIAIPVSFTAWYFYLKPNVVSYYKELQRPAGK